MTDDIVTLLRHECRCDATTCVMCRAAEEIEYLQFLVAKGQQERITRPIGKGMHCD